MSFTANAIGNVQLPIDGTVANPSLSFGGSTTNSGTGIYGTYGQIVHALNGVVALTLTPTALTLGSGVVLVQDITSAAQVLSAAGAISVSNPETIINNATGGSFTMTLAAPSNQDGQQKIIKLGTATSGATLAMTNIAMSGAYTPTGTTTLTFTSAGDCVVLRAVGAKWQYMGGSAVAS